MYGVGWLVEEAVELGRKEGRADETQEEEPAHGPEHGLVAELLHHLCPGPVSPSQFKKNKQRRPKRAYIIVDAADEHAQLLQQALFALHDEPEHLLSGEPELKRVDVQI
jgi:hypothetical protein